MVTTEAQTDYSPRDGDRSVPIARTIQAEVADRLGSVGRGADRPVRPQ